MSPEQPAPFLPHPNEDLSLARSIQENSEIQSRLSRVLAGRIADENAVTFGTRGVKMTEEARAEVDQLFEDYDQFITRISAKYYGTLFESSEVDQIGRIGFLHALVQYNVAGGGSFETYAYAKIRGKIADAFREYGTTIRIPRSAYRALKKLKNIQFESAQTGKPFPSVPELSETLGVSESRIAALLSHMHSPESLEQGNFGQDADADEHSPRMEWRVADSAPPAETVVIQKELLDTIADIAKRRLSPRLQFVLTNYFGLEGAKERKLHEIGALLGVSESRACQLLQQGISMISIHLLASGWDDKTLGELVNIDEKI
jgi:RNA polymerase sigma factor FliA